MATTTDPVVRAHKREVIEKAVLRFCGDSGDGMQITGSQFTNTVALYGNDLATLPDFPAEIRAPAGTLPGVRGFQAELTKLTRAALKELGLDAKGMDRCKNFFALGMCYWLYNRSMETSLRWIEDKFKSKPQLVQATRTAMQAGY